VSVTYSTVVRLVLIYSMTHNLSTIGSAKGFGGEAGTNDHRSLTSTLLFFSQKETLTCRARTVGQIVIYFFMRGVYSNCQLHYHEKTLPPRILQCAVTMSKYLGILYIVLSIPVFFLSWLLISFFKNIYVSRLIDVLLHSALYGDE
jgi:hypothetical protein